MTAAARPGGGWRVPAAVATGGALGSAARYGLASAWPTDRDGFPWATFVTNALGCLAIGVLMAALVTAGSPHPLLRPFLGTGVLGGFTTFSAYAVDVTRLTGEGRPLLAVGYLVGTVLVALAAVLLGGAAVRAVLR